MTRRVLNSTPLVASNERVFFEKLRQLKRKRNQHEGEEEEEEGKRITQQKNNNNAKKKKIISPTKKPQKQFVVVEVPEDSDDELIVDFNELFPDLNDTKEDRTIEEEDPCIDLVSNGDEGEGEEGKSKEDRDKGVQKEKEKEKEKEEEIDDPFDFKRTVDIDSDSEGSDDSDVVEDADFKPSPQKKQKRDDEDNVQPSLSELKTTGVNQSKEKEANTNTNKNTTEKVVVSQDNVGQDTLWLLEQKLRSQLLDQQTTRHLISTTTPIPNGNTTSTAVSSSVTTQVSTGWISKRSTTTTTPTPAIPSGLSLQDELRNSALKFLSESEWEKLNKYFTFGNETFFKPSFKPLNHQMDGLLTTLKRHVTPVPSNKNMPIRSMLMGDDMGLGKTMLLLMYINCIKRKMVPKTNGELCGASLLVVPKTVLPNYKLQIEKHCITKENTTYLELDKMNKKIEGDNVRYRPIRVLFIKKGCQGVTKEEMMSADIVIMTYGLISSLYEETKVGAIETSKVPQKPATEVYPELFDEWGNTKLPILHVEDYKTKKSKNTMHVYGIKWLLFTLDEAHQARNQKTRRSSSVTKIMADAYVAMTGTPAQNKVIDYFSLLRFIRAPEILKYEDDSLRNELRVMGDSSPAAKDMTKLKDEYVIRRNQIEVAKKDDSMKLPPIMFWAFSSEQKPKEKMLYTALYKGLEELVRWMDLDERNYVTPASSAKNGTNQRRLDNFLEQLSKDRKKKSSNPSKPSKSPQLSGADEDEDTEPDNTSSFLSEEEDDDEGMEKDKQPFSDVDIMDLISEEEEEEEENEEEGEERDAIQFLKKLLVDDVGNGETIKKIIKNHLMRMRQACSVPCVMMPDVLTDPCYGIRCTKADNLVHLIRSRIFSKEGYYPKLQSEDPEEVEKFKKLLEEKTFKVIVFFHFVEPMKVISERLTMEGIKHNMIIGSMSDTARLNAMNEFNNNDNIQVMLASISASDTGWDASRANRVVFFDPGYNPKQEWQAYKRVYRFGIDPNFPCHITWLIGRRTCEENIHEIGLQKLKEVDTIDNGNWKNIRDADMKSLTDKRNIKEVFLNRFVEQSFGGNWNSNTSSSSSNLVPLTNTKDSSAIVVVNEEEEDEYNKGGVGKASKKRTLEFIDQELEYLETMKRKKIEDALKEEEERKCKERNQLFFEKFTGLINKLAEDNIVKTTTVELPNAMVIKRCFYGVKIDPAWNVPNVSPSGAWLCCKSPRLLTHVELPTNYSLHTKMAPLPKDHQKLLLLDMRNYMTNGMQEFVSLIHEGTRDFLDLRHTKEAIEESDNVKDIRQWKHIDALLALKLKDHSELLSSMNPSFSSSNISTPKCSYSDIMGILACIYQINPVIPNSDKRIDGVMFQYQATPYFFLFRPENHFAINLYKTNWMFNRLSDREIHQCFKQSENNMIE